MSLKLFFISIMMLLISCCLAHEIKYYVSKNGNDTWSGKKAEPSGKNDGPFASIKRAQQAIRELKKSDSLSVPVIVYIKSGCYELNKAIIFEPEDSGYKDRTITYTSYPGEKVIISGGKRLYQWSNDYNNRWSCDLSNSDDLEWTFQQLFVNDNRRFRARVPNEGFFRVKDPLEEPDWPFHHFRYQFKFFPGDLISIWRNLNDVEIVLLHFWSDAHCPISDIDPNTLTVTLSTPAWRRFTDDHTQKGARYFVANVYEEMDQPGEWYFDRSRREIYYLAFQNEQVLTSNIVAPNLDQLVLFQGNPLAQEFVQYITLSNLTFSYTDWELPPSDAGDHQAADTVPGAIEMIGAHCISIKNCVLSHLGTYGIDINDGCTNIIVQENDMYDLGGGGVKISGSRAEGDSLLKTSHNLVLDNSIKDVGNLFFASVGILLMHGSNNIISHNYISDLYYTGISCGMEWGYKPSATFNNIIEYNHIENAGQGYLSDMGGIYTLGISPGTVIRNNLIHKIYAHGYGGWGIYTDEGSSDILVENNIVYDTYSAGFHQHYGKNNIIRNNIFVNGETAQIMRSRHEDHLSFQFEKNIVYWGNGDLFEKHWKGDTSNFIFKKNIYFRTDSKPIKYFKISKRKWLRKGQDKGSLFVDPQFVNVKNGDFNLHEDSPALKIGFEPIDMTTIGPRMWPKDIEEISYFSEADSTFQPALFYDSGSDSAKPLLVGLHTWSSDYKQKDSVPYLNWCKLKDWVFIHPNFRGPNNNPQATGSHLVVGDILSAIDHAIKNARIDTNRIYCIGASGGGYTSLLMAGKSERLWAGMSVWVPISDLEEWYYESLARNTKYAAEIVASCGGIPGENEEIDFNYYERSPRNFLYNAKNIAMDINAGIFDGIKGSVPTSQSIKAYNILAESEDQISESQIEYILRKAKIPTELLDDFYDPYYSEHKVLFRRFSNKVRLTLFDGDHEIIPNAALHWLEKQRKDGH